MKIRLVVALVGLAIWFAVPTFAQQKEPTPSEQDRQHLDAHVKKSDEAWNNNDAAALAATFTEDAANVTNKGPIYGREAIEKRYADLFKHFHVSNHLNTVDEEWSNGDATDIAPVVIEGLPVKVISSGKSYKVFEQYPWEGHSSNYGPKGNRLNSSYGVGLGKNISSALLLRHGDWIHMPDIGWRQINEFASKKDSIEFFARYRDEYKSKHPRITIDMVVFALPSEKDAKDMRDEYKRKHPRITIDSAIKPES
jgi:hypothetical protein